MEELLFSFFRILPVLIIFTVTLFIIFLENKRFWAFMLGGIILNGIIWFIVGTFTGKYMPDLAERPQLKHCAYTETNKDISFSGLPSGHCQTIGFVSAWVIIYLIANRVNLEITIPLSLILVLFTYIMMYSRAVYYKCHTWFQAMSGTFLGILTAGLLFYFY
jgi:hypothetical protein